MSYEQDAPLPRRRFLTTLAALAAVAPLTGFARVADGCAAMGRMPTMRGPHPHPTPRPGITGAKVLTKAQLEHNPDAAPIFDMVREIPQIADGIRCHCGCAELPDFRSLLSCYEGDGMAQHCEICQGQGKLAYTLFKQGKSLDDIRAAIDARWN